MEAKRFNPFENKFLQDPYPVYAYMMKNHPVYYWEEEEKWYLFKYEDVKELMRNKNFCPPGKYNNNNLPSWRKILIDSPKLDLEKALMKAKFIVQDWLVLAEEEKHLLIRKTLMKCFIPTELEKLEKNCDNISKEILQQHPLSIEIINEYALQISMKVLLKVMGWDTENILLLKKHTTNILNHFKVKSSKQDEFMACSSIIELAKIFIKASDEQFPLSSGIIHSLRDMVKANEISEDEFIGNCIFFLFAGQESSQLLIGNGIWLLAQRPDLVKKLKENPKLWDNAIKEILRYECPNPYFNRVAMCDFEFGEKKIKKGERIIGIINSANHDEEIFHHPDTFNILRGDNKHVSFGVGNHYCLGAHLAEIEGRIAIKNFFEAFPNAKISGDVKWIENFRVRGLQKLQMNA